MEDDKKNAGESESGSTAGPGNEPGQPKESDGGDGKKEENRTFTQEQVNEIVRERLERSSKSIYERYGVSDEKGLDELVAMAQAYQTTKSEYSELQKENAGLRERIVFSENGILPEKQDDARTYFKGKGLEMSDEALKQVLQTHPEWVSAKPQSVQTTTVVPIGKDRYEPELKDEESEAAKVFGFTKFVK